MCSIQQHFWSKYAPTFFATDFFWLIVERHRNLHKMEHLELFFSHIPRVFTKITRIKILKDGKVVSPLCWPNYCNSANFTLFYPNSSLVDILAWHLTNNLSNNQNSVWPWTHSNLSFLCFIFSLQFGETGQVFNL